MKNSRFIEVDAEVRYWEDASVNGEEDTDGNIPLREGDCWRPVIDLTTGQIADWPGGVEAEVHYKVCDQGQYWLLDEGRTRIAKWKGYYVPDEFLCVGDTGFGDYIIFKVNGGGLIIGWKPPPLNADQWVPIDA